MGNPDSLTDLSMLDPASLSPNSWPHSPHLCTQLEVHHDDTDLRAGHHQDDEDEEQEAKEVIELILPDCLWTHHSWPSASLPPPSGPSPGIPCLFSEWQPSVRTSTLPVTRAGMETPTGCQ